MSGCNLHGAAYTYGCPGCEWDTADELDAPTVADIRRRLRWFRWHNLCERFIGHWWREVEPHVTTCRLCRVTKFDGSAPPDAFYRFFNVPYTTTSLAPQGEATEEHTAGSGDKT